MQVIFPVAHVEIDRAKALIEWIKELDGAIPQHEFVLLTSSRVELKDQAELGHLVREVFPSFAHVHQQVPDERNLIAAPKALFRIALIEWVERKRPAPFLWLESDCVPMRRGWLDELGEEYRRCGKPFMGCFYPHPNLHVNGVSVWPPNARRFNPFLVAESGRTFDNDHPELTLRRAHNTPLILRMLANPRAVTPMSFPTAESLSVIPKEVALFHGSKDGTLIERLRERGLPPHQAPVQPPRRRGVRQFFRTAMCALWQKPCLDTVTLVCADTRRPDMAFRAIKHSLGQCAPKKVLFFTNDDSLPYAIKVPHINGLDGYSNFITCRAPEYVTTTHALIIQSDGYVVRGGSWDPEFLKWDYIGAPTDMTDDGKITMGNGGFSLRSRKLMEAVRRLPGPYHPEDQIICIRHRKALESQGLRFAPTGVATAFSAEMSPWRNQFGFHSFATKLPPDAGAPKVFHHSGDWGDIIYGLPAIKAMNGGVLFISPQCWPTMPPRQIPTVESVRSLASLLQQQPYIWECKIRRSMPASTDYDLNRFRDNYRPNAGSLTAKQLAVCGAQWPEDKPWLTVDFPMVIPSRPIVVHMCPRYRKFNPYFPWKDLVRRYGGRMVAVGMPEEHAALISECGYVPYVSTRDFLELARVIAGAKVFIGSQSSPMSIALGLGKNVIQDLLLEDQNCRFRRKNAMYPADADFEIPEAWLK